MKQFVARSDDSLSPQDEALAVLAEMARRAEQRLVEASREFEDIAHEMEWRLMDWLRLSAEHKKLERQAALVSHATPRFNMRARALKPDRSAKRTDNWSRMVALIGLRTERNAVALGETVQAIKSRNAEGQLLQEEIFALQDKIRRIHRSLARRPAVVAAAVVPPDAVASALSRLSLPYGAGGDETDPATLVTAACVVSRVVSRVADDQG